MLKRAIFNNRLSTIFGLVTVAVLLLGYGMITAESVTTNVTVGNEAPAFTVTVAENPVSDGTTPTNVGSNVTFEATATDSSNEDYYLIICETNSVSATNGAAPTCPGGAWAVSSATTSGNQASASYTTLDGDAETNAWFAFVCDGNASAAACSSSSQGSGSSGSPFNVNHAPDFSAASNNGPFDPGDTATFSTTASDSDTDTVADTVTLLVCDSSGVTGTSCDGTQLCVSSAAASNPTCDYVLPAVQPHGSIDAYVYVFDNHDFASDGSAQGTNVPMVVNDVAPAVSAVTINGGSDITLTEGSTTAVGVTGTVTDNNSCQDITGVTTSVYRSGITYAGCDIVGEANNNNCYAVVSCSVSGGSCTGSTDASANYTCSVNIQYHADPTVASTQFPAENWLSSVVASDGSTTVDTEVGTGVEMQSLIGLSVTAAINFGSLGPGSDTGTLSETVNVAATGNVGLDVDLSGTDLTDGPESITVDNIEYALSAVSYGSGTDLSGTDTELEINVGKTTVTASDANVDSYWGLLVPLGTAPGSYSGTVTVTGVLGETGDW